MRYREKNSIYKRRYSYHIGIIFPSTYQASLSSLGLQVLYYSLNLYREIYAERVVFDKLPSKSIETSSTLDKFDVILAMTSYELDYPVIIHMLKSSGIPIMNEKRRGKPYIIFGGPSPSANPYPLQYFSDAVFRGEIEDPLPKFVDALSNINDKKEFQEELAGIPGFWVPGIAEEKRSVITMNLDNAFHPIKQLQSMEFEPVWGKSFLLEPSRGCNRGCAFCLEGSIYRPRRERSWSTVRQLIDEGPEVNNVMKVAFYTLSFFDSIQGERILEYLVEKRLKGSIPSVRADALDEHRVELVKRIGQKNLTIAPETPVRRLQLKIGKIIRSETVMNVAEWCRKNGLSLKLYYMYGLPGERKDDLLQIVFQVKDVWSILRNRFRVKVSINPFVPKPLTRLWNTSMEEVRRLKEKEKMLKKMLSPIAIVETYPPRKAYIQYMINKLGKDAFKYIIKLSEKSKPAGTSSGLEET